MSSNIKSNLQTLLKSWGPLLFSSVIFCALGNHLNFFIFGRVNKKLYYLTPSAFNVISLYRVYVYVPIQLNCVPLHCVLKWKESSLCSNYTIHLYNQRENGSKVLLPIPRIGHTSYRAFVAKRLYLKQLVVSRTFLDTEINDVSQTARIT